MVLLSQPVYVFPCQNWICSDVEDCHVQLSRFISDIEVSGDLGEEGTNGSSCRWSIQNRCMLWNVNFKDRIDIVRLWEWRPEEHGKVLHLKSGKEVETPVVVTVPPQHTPWLCPIVSGRRCWPSPIGWCAILFSEEVCSVYCCRCFYKSLAWPSHIGWCAIFIPKKCLLTNLNSTVYYALIQIYGILL